MVMKKQKSLLLQQLHYGTKNGGADISITKIEENINYQNINWDFSAKFKL